MKKTTLFQTSFRFKIFLLFFGFTIGISLLIGLILYSVSAQLLKSQMQDTLRNNLINASNSFDNILQSIGSTTAATTLNAEMVQALQSSPNYEDYDFYEISYGMRKRLQNIADSNDLIKSVYVLSEDGHYFYKNQMNRTYTPTELLEIDLSRQLRSMDESCWGILTGQSLFEQYPTSTLSIMTKVRNTSMTKILGYLCVNINMELVRDIFQDISLEKSGYMSVFTSDMRILFHPDPQITEADQIFFSGLVDPNKSHATLFKGDFMVSYIVSPTSGIIYSACIPISEVVAPATSVRNITLLVMTISLGGALLYAIFMSRWLFAPIRTLVVYMKRAGAGESRIQTTEERHDEMGVLYQSFNQMITEIGSLMDRLHLQEMLSKELQLENLLIQLNPHFLYNTLDAIHWSARENKMDDVCRMTFLLSKYFRTNLSDGQEFITVQRAAQMVESYIEIHSLRYEGRFNYSIEVDETIRGFKVPKYLFQPLVENAIHHGIERRNGNSFLSVSWRDEEDQLRFSVEDNGPGIPPNKLAELQQMLATTPDPRSGSFALQNISLQLTLYYGTLDPLFIESKLNQGTTVSFTIPIKKEV